MYMQNTHPVLAVLVAAVGLPAYQLQHLPTMQQNLERFYRSVSNAVSDVTNGTSIAFNQHDLVVNHCTLKPSANGPTSGAYVCILDIVPNHP